MQIQTISAELEQLGQDVLSECYDILSSGQELWPLLCFIKAEQEPQCICFADDDKNICIEEARAYLREQEDIERYVLAYDALVCADETTEELHPAVVFEFAEKGMECAYSGYSLYKLADKPEDFLCTEPQAAGIEELLL